MRPPRVVLDTNLVLSALVLANGRLSALRHAWQAGRFIALVSRPTTAELMRVLVYPKFRLSADEQQDLLADYLPWCETVRIPSPPPATPPCRDRSDEPFLQLALAGRADGLVTGDRDLLVLDGTLPCPILTADIFMTRHCTSAEE